MRDHSSTRIFSRCMKSVSVHCVAYHELRADCYIILSIFIRVLFIVIRKLCLQIESFLILNERSKKDQKFATITLNCEKFKRFQLNVIKFYLLMHTAHSTSYFTITFKLWSFIAFKSELKHILLNFWQLFADCSMCE